MVKMEIKGLLMDPVSNMPVVVLRDSTNGVFLPIWEMGKVMLIKK